MAYLGLDETRPFRPSSRYNHSLDVLTYKVEQGTCVADRVDSFLTVLWNAERTDLVGIKCKGFRYCFNQLKEKRGWGDRDFLPLVEVLEALFELGLGDSIMDDHRTKYDLAKKCVASFHLTRDQIREVAA